MMRIAPANPVTMASHWSRVTRSPRAGPDSAATMSGAEKEIDVASASATLPMAVMNMLVDASWTTERPI